jgi:hypothetical protein
VSAKREDLTGRRYGKLIVVKQDLNKVGSNRIYWVCQCDCGNIKSIMGQNLKYNISKSCGCASRVNIENDVLIDLYVNQKLSMRKVAEIFNTTHHTIQNRLKLLGISTRGNYDLLYYIYRRTPIEKVKKYIDDGGYLNFRRYGREHRIVMEKHLGRKLTNQETVHHIDGNKLNNDINNLFLFPNCSMHFEYHHHIKNNTYISPNDFAMNYKPINKEEITECACGCGEIFHKYDSGNRPRTYKCGHNMRKRRII